MATLNIDTRPETEVQVSSPTNAGEWEQARLLLADFSRWFQQESGYAFSAVQDEAAEEMASPSTFYQPPRGRFFIARVNGRVAGTTAIRVLEPETVEIKRVYVDPGARGLGLAARMLEAAVTGARDLGARRVVLESHSVIMSAAIRMYRRRGFVEIPDYTDLAARAEGVIAMELTLAAASTT